MKFLNSLRLKNGKCMLRFFIGNIRLELDLQDFKALACQKELSALVDNNFSWRLKPNSGI